MSFSSNFHPLVSIVIPVYNGSNFLREAIDSALGQSYNNIEVIVVNDGSNDSGATAEIALSYGDRIQYYSKENGGVATALNLGIEKMRGEYFSWLSHDDIYLENKIESQIDFINYFDLKDAIIFGDYINIDENGKTISEHCTHFLSVNDVFVKLYMHSWMNCCTLIVPKKYIVNAGMFNPKYKTVQDYELYLQLSKYIPFVYQSNVVLKSRQHKTQGSRSQKLHMREVSSFYRRHLYSVIEHLKSNSYLGEKAVLKVLPEIICIRIRQKHWLCACHVMWELLKLQQFRNNILRFIGNYIQFAVFYFFQKAAFLQKIKYFSRLFSPIGNRESQKRLNFEKIYTDDGFAGGGESASGGGSTLLVTRILRWELPNFLQKLSIHSILDIPCGDFNWMQHVNLQGIQYIGGDIVPELIMRNNEKYADSEHSFENLNLIYGPLPKVDLIFCRDCLVHMPFNDIFQAIRSIKHSRSTWLLTTTFTELKDNSNLIGTWRPLNFCLPPFNFPKPVALLDERCFEGGGRFKDKQLGLWKIEDLPIERLDTNKNMPLVSVITPTYNREKFLLETINSVINQSYPNIEYIIVDDGSNDNTKDLINEFKDKLQYIYHENIGEPKSVNKGCKIANGKYILVINSDDPLCNRDTIKLLVDGIESESDSIVAYSDWKRIDESGNILGYVKLPDYNIFNMVQSTNVCIGPGMLISKNVLEDLDYRNEAFLYTGDTELAFRLALRGKLHHVPQVLATHREHAGMLSKVCDQSQTRQEIIQIFEDTMSSPLLPDALKKLKKEILLNVYRVFKKYEQVLLIGDRDLVGNKFNGHNLHKYLQQTGRNAFHLVHEKKSDDATTFIHASEPRETYLQRLICSSLFLDADIIHLHLIHNTPFSLYYLPLLSKLKPIVWTLHDPWALSGHCVHHGECDSWKTHCCDCVHLETPFPLERDTSALEFEIKKQAIQNSCLHAIVASTWMREKVAQSPIWTGKSIHLVPFGIDQDLFAPGDTMGARAILGIPPDLPVLFARVQPHFKGLKILEQTLHRLAEERSFVLLVVGDAELLPTWNSVVRRDFGWVDDDARLATLYQACDLMLMPSEHETFGMMAIEAMSCGKMVLALDVSTSALTDVIDAPRCGIAVPKEDYADELIRLLNHPQEIIRRGELSLSFARENYRLKDYINKILDVYHIAMDEFLVNENEELVLQQVRKHAMQIPIAQKDYNNSVFPVSSVRYYDLCKQYYIKYGLQKTLLKIFGKTLEKTKRAAKL